MTKKIYLETFEKCAGSLCFTLLEFRLVNKGSYMVNLYFSASFFFFFGDLIVLITRHKYEKYKDLSFKHSNTRLS